MNKLGWSFCIVTAPGNEQILSEAIKKINQEFRNAPHEIIVIGNPQLNPSEFEFTQFIPFKEQFFKLSLTKHAIIRVMGEKSLKPLFFRYGPICHKKNLAAKHAQYDKLCVMHDYVGIEPGWLSGFEQFGNDWDVAMNIILNKDGTRHRDWMAWDHPAITNSSRGDGACLIPYDKYTKYMYISGTYFCVKRGFFINNPLDERLFWGECEDVEWSLRVREKTQFKMNVHSMVKYLKLKDINGAPNCESWRLSSKKMLEVFGDKDIA